MLLSGCVSVFTCHCCGMFVQMWSSLGGVMWGNTTPDVSTCEEFVCSHSAVLTLFSGHDRG